MGPTSAAWHCRGLSVLALLLLTPPPASGAVITLHPGDWEKWGRVQARAPVAVNFYAHHEFKLELSDDRKASAAPHCPHCPRFTNTWESVSVFAAAHGITVGQVSCTDQKEFCEKKNVYSYPTIILYLNETTEVEHKGKLSLIELLQWMEEHTGEKVTESIPAMMMLRNTVWTTVRTVVDALEEVLGTSNKWVVGTFLIILLMPPVFVTVSLSLYCCAMASIWCLRRRRRAAAAAASKDK
eukprot:TRINITY_DN39170_c0_g1_i1.p1 TRINITY_DN39170_c0_g1~~TRINITY_DN39170_c0_g1_i1.p1  ORF type:complete len:240 (+),score=51.51 TRINITY_DN39170_c0_g1_i1:56-775(+)